MRDFYLFFLFVAKWRTVYLAQVFEENYVLAYKDKVYSSANTPIQGSSLLIGFDLISSIVYSAYYHIAKAIKTITVLFLLPNSFTEASVRLLALYNQYNSCRISEILKFSGMDEKCLSVKWLWCGSNVLGVQDKKIG